MILLEFKSISVRGNIYVETRKENTINFIVFFKLQDELTN